MMKLGSGDTGTLWRAEGGSVVQLWPTSNEPPAISTAAVWWADDLDLADGDPVSTWTDRVNTLAVAQATPDFQPILDVDGIGGHASVNFDGSNDYLGSGSLFTSSSGCVIAVARITDPLQGQSLWSQGGNNTNRYLLGTTRYSTGGQIEVQQRNADTNDVVYGSTSVSAGTDVVLEWASTGTEYTYRYNNNTQSLSVTAGLNNGDWFGDVQFTDRWTIGALRYSSTVGALAGRIAFLAVFDEPLSTSDRAALYGWISDYYGITVA